MPLITVGIPVYYSEKYLIQTLKSLMIQDFNSFEVIVVSNASPGKSAEGWLCKKITRIMQKEFNKYRKQSKLEPVKIRYVEHSENRGLVESKRTLCFEAKGEFYTQLDSDDVMEPGSLTALYNALIETDSDIVQGSSTAGYFDENGKFIKSEYNRNGFIHYGEITGHDIMTKWLVGGEFTSVLWGKLVRRNLLLKAFDNIPYTKNSFADDILVFFFLARYLKKYTGIKQNIILYRDNTGFTSRQRIDSLKKWEITCSAANCFTIISDFLSNDHSDFVLTEEEESAIRDKTIHFLVMALHRLNSEVIDELKPAAYNMLCDYWGKEFVNQVDEALAREATLKSQLQEEK